MTTYLGLRIHQGKSRCKGNNQIRACTVNTGQTRRNRRTSVLMIPPLHPVREWASPHSMMGRKVLTAPSYVQCSVASKLAMLVYEEGILRFGLKPKRRTVPKQGGRMEWEILQLVRERRLLHKAWRKAQGQEKEGVKCLWDQIKSRLAHLRQVDRITCRKRRGWKEKARASFLKNPFKCARGLLDRSVFGTLKVTAEELEIYIKRQLSISQRETPLGTPGHIPRPPTAINFL